MDNLEDILQWMLLGLLVWELKLTDKYAYNLSDKVKKLDAFIKEYTTKDMQFKQAVSAYVKANENEKFNREEGKQSQANADDS